MAAVAGSWIRASAAVALASMCCATAVAQTPRSAVQPPPSKVRDVAEQQEFQQLLQTQRRALASGDAEQIAAATRPLAAAALRELAMVDLLQGKPTDAESLFRQSIAVQDTASARLELASLLLRSGRAGEAVTEARAVTTADPGDAAAWAVLGSACRTANQGADAVAAFTRSLELRSDINVAYALGSSLLAVHDTAKAATIFDRLVKASGNDPVWMVAVGDAYRDAGYLPEAAARFRQAIAQDPKAPHAEFFLGLTELQMNQWGPNSESFRHFREAVRLDPKDYVSNFYLGALESTDGSDLPASNRHLRAATEANPRSPEAWLYLGLNAVREKDTVAAKADLRQAIDLTGNDEGRNNYQVRRAYFALGRLLLSEGDRTGGEALLTKYKHAEQASVAESGASIAQTMGPDASSHALTGLATAAVPSPVADPNTPADATAPVARLPKAEQDKLEATEQELRALLASSFNDLGTAEARQGAYAPALADFKQAESWGTPSEALLRNLGIAAFRLGDYAESARALGSYLQAKPDDTHAREMLAMSQFSQGKFPDAAASFGKAEALTRQDPRAAYSWAFSLARTGQQQQANALASELEAQPLPADALNLVCHVFLDTEAYEQSATCFRKVSAEDPALKLAHYQTGESLVRLDRAAEALPEFRAELALSPNDPNVQYSLAYALLQTSQKAEAQKILQGVVAADPAQPQAQYQLGKLLLEEGDATQAVDHLELAEKSDPAPDYIHYQLATAYRKLGRAADAERELRIYREIKDKARAISPIPKGNGAPGGSTP